MIKLGSGVYHTLFFIIIMHEGFIYGVEFIQVQFAALGGMRYVSRQPALIISLGSRIVSGSRRLTLFFLEKGLRHRGKNNVREQIFFLLQKPHQFLSRFFQLRLKQVCRPALEGYFIFLDFFQQVGVYLPRRPAVKPFEIVFNLRQDNLVTLAGDDIHDGLCAYDLA